MIKIFLTVVVKCFSGFARTLAFALSLISLSHVYAATNTMSTKPVDVQGFMQDLVVNKGYLHCGTPQGETSFIADLGPFGSVAMDVKMLKEGKNTDTFEGDCTIDQNQEKLTCEKAKIEIDLTVVEGANGLKGVHRHGLAGLSEETIYCAVPAQYYN